MLDEPRPERKRKPQIGLDGELQEDFPVPTPHEKPKRKRGAPPDRRRERILILILLGLGLVGGVISAVGFTTRSEESSADKSPGVAVVEASVPAQEFQSISAYLDTGGYHTVYYPTNWVGRVENNGAIVVATNWDLVNQIETAPAQTISSGNVGVGAIVIPTIAQGSVQMSGGTIDTSGLIPALSTAISSADTDAINLIVAPVVNTSPQADNMSDNPVLSMETDVRMDLGMPIAFHGDSGFATIATGMMHNAGSVQGVIVTTLGVPDGIARFTFLTHPDEVDSYTALAQAMVEKYQYTPAASK